MRQRIRRDWAGALADKELKPGTAVLGGGKRHPAWRQHRDIAAIAALIEHAKPPALSGTGAEIEGMLDDLAKTRGLDRKRVMPLIAEQDAIALIGVVVLVIREPLFRPQITLVDTGRVAIGGAHTGQHGALRIQTDILDQEIADRHGGGDDLARQRLGSSGWSRRDQQRDGQNRSCKGPCPSQITAETRARSGTGTCSDRPRR